MSVGLKGLRVLVTAGPTRERWDAVRFLSNYSSGKMGYALADAARRLGAEVTLVSGPVALAPPRGVKTVMVESAREMHRQVRCFWPRTNLLLMAAAVADYRPRQILSQKIKKTILPVIELARTTDILTLLGKRKSGRYLVGFAAESSQLVARARRKLVEKNLDCIAANKVGGKDGAMGGDNNEITLLFAAGRQVRLGRMSKQRAARRMLGEIGRDMGRETKKNVEL